MNEILWYLIAFLIFPGFIFAAVFGLLVQWVDRKVTARVQWRVGPPLFQPFYDLFKLFNKELLLPPGAKRNGFLLAPILATTSAALLTTMVGVIFIRPEVHFVGDVVVMIYLMIIPPLCIIWGGFASGNPLSAMGAAREAKLMLAYELPFLIVIATPFFRAQTLSFGQLLQYQMSNGSFLSQPSFLLSFVAALLCLQAKLGQVPFDIPEAECEIMEGPLLEYSGPALGLYKTTQAIQIVALPAFLVGVFWGGNPMQGWGILLNLLKYLLIIVIVVLIKNTNPRVRIDQAIRFFWGWVTLLAVAGMILMFLGY
ncbi:MAG: hydrogenase [Calditrichia bacterium]